MGLSKLTTAFKIQSESRSGLFFDKWQYSISFYQLRISDIRGLNSYQLNANIENRRHSYYLKDNYTPEVISDLNTTLALLLAETDLKITVSGNWCNVYTNDVTLLDRILTNCSYIRLRYVKQAVVNRPRDVVLLKSADYSFRTYLRAQWVSIDKIAQLENFFKSQGNDIRPCTSLKQFVNSSSNRIQRHWLASHYFVDYNDPGYQVMLELILPRAGRKTLPIAERINS